MEGVNYDRVLLKISGEALSGPKGIFDPDSVNRLVDQIKSVHGKVQLAIVIGGGNIIRGSKLVKTMGINQTMADYIGMSATIVNGQVLEAALKLAGIEARLMSAISAPSVAEDYIFKRARHHIRVGRIVILAGGTGHARCTTDTAAVIRACELEMGIVMKGTKVSGVFDEDPEKNPNANLLQELSYDEFINKNLVAILDQTAVTTAKENKMPIVVFNILEPGSLAKAVAGNQIGSLIS